MLKKVILKIQYLWVRRSSESYVKFLRKKGIKIGFNSRIRYPYKTWIDLTRPCLVEIGNNVDMNLHFQIYTHDYGTWVFINKYHDFVNSSGKVKIGSNIYFGTNVIVLKGVEIGDNCIIGAGSIVTKNIPANSVAVGVPAEVVFSLNDYYEKRKAAALKEAKEYG